MSRLDSRARCWCFTLNNYEQKDAERLAELDCKYIVFGYEVGESGTKHLQGYVEFTHGKTLSAVKKYTGCPSIHLETRKGTPEQAATYCKKDKNFTEKGIISHQGKRTDLDDVAEAIVDKSFDPLDFPVMMIKFHKGIDALLNCTMKDREHKPYIEWRFGDTGVGKTHGVIQKHGIENCYIKDGTMWWNNYSQQDVILIDDFDGNWPFRDLLRLLDHYPYQGQYKGGYIKICSDYIYITCEYPPDHYYNGTQLLQIKRRIDNIIMIERDKVLDI